MKLIDIEFYSFERTTKCNVIKSSAQQIALIEILFIRLCFK